MYWKILIQAYKQILFFQSDSKGLMWDMMDNTAEPPQTSVNDQVYGFTIQQIFAALQSDATSISSYRSRLIQQNAGYQTTQISALFTSYNY